MPILCHIINKGNTTVYEWRTGIEPKIIEKPDPFSFNFGDEINKIEADSIDFGELNIDTSNVQLETPNDVKSKKKVSYFNILIRGMKLIGEILELLMMPVKKIWR